MTAIELQLKDLDKIKETAHSLANKTRMIEIEIHKMLVRIYLDEKPN